MFSFIDVLFGSYRIPKAKQYPNSFGIFEEKISNVLLVQFIYSVKKLIQMKSNELPQWLGIKRERSEFGSDGGIEANRKPGPVLHVNGAATINLGPLFPTGSSDQPESIERATLKHFPIRSCSG